MTDAQALIERLFDAVDSERWDEADTVLHPDAQMTLPVGGRMGPAGWVDVNRSYAVAVPDGRHTVTRVVSDGEGRFAFEGIYSGRHTGPLAMPGGELPASDNNVRLPMCGIVTHRDGRITSMTVYFDRMTLFGQLGIVSEPAS
jgi:predicted ester cyclase